MLFFTLIESCLFFFFVAYLVYHYASKDVPLYVCGTVYLSWILNFSIVILLPLDIYYSQVIEDDETKKTAFTIIYDIWILIYWSNFILTWVFLPIFQEYEDAGEFTPEKKFKRSLKNNLIFYAVLGVFGIAFIGYLKYKSNMNEANMIGFLIAMANCFGIFLIVMLLGYGLVSIPRNLWRSGNQELTLKFIQFQATVAEETRSTAEYELGETIKCIYALDNRKDIKNEFKEFLQQMMSLIPESILNEHISLLKATDIADINAELKEITESKLASLHRRLKKGLAEHRRAETWWENLLEEAFLMEDIIENRNSPEQRIRSTFWVERHGSCGSLQDKLLWHWHVKIKNRLYRALGGVFAFFSIMVVIGQITIFSDLKIFEFKDIIAFGHGFFFTQAFTLIPMLYIAFAVFVGLFNLKISGFYGLYSDHQTDAPSLLFTSINFARVSAPLCFNFLNMIKVTNCGFNKVMGNINIVPIFGSDFTSFFPIVLVVLCIFNVYDIYGKVLGFLGLKQFQFAENFNDDKIEEGKQLLYKARLIRERKFLSLNSTNLKDFHGYNSRVYETSLNNYFDNVGEEMRLKDSYDLEGGSIEMNAVSNKENILEKYRKKKEQL